MPTGLLSLLPVRQTCPDCQCQLKLIAIIIFLKPYKITLTAIKTQETTLTQQTWVQILLATLMSYRASVKLPLKFHCKVFNQQIIDNTAAEVWNTDITTDSIHAAVNSHDCDICSLATDT